MAENIQNTKKGSRIYFLDILRTFLVFLVVLNHSGWVYESSGVGAFFWIVDDNSTNDLAGKINLIIDIFVMSAIFFISGYFAPKSLKSKSAWKFLKTKLKRLIVPWIIAVFTLIPLYKVIFLYSRNIPQENWTTYFHFTNGIYNQNWLWFLPVLFLFDMLYLCITKLKLKLPETGLKTAIASVFVVGLIYSIVMDLFKLEGWTKTVLLDFQNERLFIYFLMFLLGGLCFKLKTFDSKPKGRILFFAVLCLFWIPISIYRHFYIQSFVYPGNFIYSEAGDSFIMWFNFHLSLLCLMYLVINTFRYYLDNNGKIRNVINNNSYNVYIIHTVVLGGIATAILNSAIPSLLKYFILVVSTYIVSNLLVYFYRTIIKPKFRIKRKGI